MTDNQFDNFFREKLINHTAPVPDGLWEKIHRENEKRPKGFFLFNIKVTGLLITAITASILMLAIYKPFGHQTVPAANDVQKESNILNTHTNSNSQLPTNSNTQAATISNQLTKVSVNEHESTESINKNQFNSTATNSENKFNHNQQIQKNFDAINSIDAHELKVSIKEESFKTNQNLLQQIETKTDLNLENSSTSNKGFDYMPAGIKSASLMNQPLMLNSTNGMIDKKLFANGHDKFIKSTIIVCPTTRRRSNGINGDWSLEFFASPDYALKSVSNISASQLYLNKKDSSERMQIGYSAGFRLVKPLNNNWLLKTGFQYSQINQKFSYRNENEVKLTTVITTRSIIRSPGDTVIVTDTSTLQQIGYSVKTIRNRYRSIDIPLTLGYQFGNEDLMIGINGGVIFNISSWYQGELLDTSFASVPMSKISNVIYKSNIGMGLYSSFSIIKRLNENTHLFFEPYFRYNLSNMTNTLSPYRQRFQVGGLAIGLRIDLNR